MQHICLPLIGQSVIDCIILAVKILRSRGTDNPRLTLVDSEEAENETETQKQRRSKSAEWKTLDLTRKLLITLYSPLLINYGHRLFSISWSSQPAFSM